MNGRTIKPTSHFFFPTISASETSRHPDLVLHSVLTIVDVRREESKIIPASSAVGL